MFGFVVLLCSLVPPCDGVGSGITSGGGDVFRGNASSPTSYVMPLLLSFLFFRLPFSLSYGFFSFSDCLLIVIF